MGTFTTSIEIGDPEGRRWQSVDVLVDTGATFTMLPRSLLEHLGVRPEDKVPFELVDGRSVEFDVGETTVRIGNRVRTTVVIFADNGVEPLLGAYTLEAFLLAVDTVNRRLVPVSGLLKQSQPDIVSPRRRFTKSLRNAVSVLEVADGSPPTRPPDYRGSLIVEYLEARLLQPLPRFFRSTEGRLVTCQHDIFALYGLRSAARGYLIGLRHHQAGLRPGHNLPDALLSWTDDGDDTNDAAQTPAQARHQAIYDSYAYDDIAHELVLNGDLGAAHALDYKVRGFCSLAEEVLRQLLQEIDGDLQYLIGPRMKFVLATWALGVMTPPFEAPDRENWDQDDRARADRLADLLGVTRTPSGDLSRDL